MNKLPIQLQILEEFIWEKPQVVVEILKKNGISVSNKPTFPEIIDKSVKAILDDNQSFVKDVFKAIETNDEANFDPITLGVSALLSIGSAIFGSRQAKKNRQAMLNATLMKLATEEKLTYANIQAMKEQGRIEIATNTVLEYSKNLQNNATAQLRDTGLFIGILAMGLAVMYSTVQIFK
jgi:hypothetical protein